MMQFFPISFPIGHNVVVVLSFPETADMREVADVATALGKTLQVSLKEIKKEDKMKTKIVTILESHKDLFRVLKQTKPKELWVRESHGNTLALGGTKADLYELADPLTRMGSYAAFLTTCLNKVEVRISGMNFQAPDPEDEEFEDEDE